MNKNAKARPVAATTERAAAEAAVAAASCDFEYTAKAPPRQVANVLLFGAENAVEGSTLAAVLGFKDRRALSKQIERERRSGQPICASVAGSKRGYFLTDDPDELQRYIRALDRRIREVRRTRDACTETLRRMTGQEIVKGWR